MERIQTVKLKKIIENFDLETLRGPEGYQDRLINGWPACGWQIPE